jgi:hypothetical protein
MVQHSVQLWASILGLLALQVSRVSESHTLELFGCIYSKDKAIPVTGHRGP